MAARAVCVPRSTIPHVSWTPESASPAPWTVCVPRRVRGAAGSTSVWDGCALRAVRQGGEGERLSPPCPRPVPSGGARF